MKENLLALSVTLLLAGVQVYAAQFTAGVSPTATTDYAITASATLEYKTHASGLTGLGVAGATGGEIDINEWLRVDFTVPQQLAEFSLCFFYDGPEHSDPMEMARIIVNGSDTYYAQVTGEATASWTGGGGVVNLSPASATGDGWFRFQNPFGSMLVDSLEFGAVDVPGSGNNSDYSLATFTTVPDVGGSLALLSLASIALACFRRRVPR